MELFVWSYRNRYLLTLTFISLLLTMVWSHHGNIMGGGETGIPFYKTERVFELTRTSWNDSGLGLSVGQSVGAWPTYWFFDQLSKFGVPGSVLQASFFWLMVFLTLISSYLLTNYFLSKYQPRVGFYAALFYLFNLFALANIWNRFLLNLILTYATLPLFVFLLVKSFKEKTLWPSFLIALLSAVFALAYSTPAQFILLWLVLSYTTLFFVFVSKENRLYMFVSFLASLIASLAINSWWLASLLSLRFSPSFQFIAEQTFVPVGNLITFEALSKSLGKISELFLLKHGDFFKREGYPFDWPRLYDNPLALALEWLSAFLIFGVIVRKRKDQGVAFFAGLFILAIILAKGSSPPFGEIFKFFFSKIQFLDVFRNPFEKFGLLLPLGAAPLFGLGVVFISEWLTKNKKQYLRVFRYLLSAYIFIFLGLPYFSNMVFTGHNSPTNDLRVGYRVRVPHYYQKANQWLTSQNCCFRFLSFPLGGEGIFNTWEKGYVGIELSHILFETPNLSLMTTIPFFHKIVSNLERQLLTFEDFGKIGGLLNASYIMLREDVDYRLTGMREPTKLKSFFEKKVQEKDSYLKNRQTFDKLTFYQLKEDFFVPKIYPAAKIIVSNENGLLDDFILGGGESGDVLMSLDQTNKERLPFEPKTKIIRPSAFFYFEGPEFLAKETGAQVFPHVNRLPTDKAYQFSLAKEKLQLLGKAGLAEKTLWQLTLLGKRLKEAELASHVGDKESLKISLRLYRESLPALIENLKKITTTTLEQVWSQEALTTTFGSHLSLIGSFENIRDEELREILKETKNLLRLELTKIKVFPIFDPRASEGFPIQRRHIYQFEVFQEGEFELILPERTYEEHFNEFPERNFVQLDDKIIETGVFYDGKNLNFGKFQFTPGKHEISFNAPEPFNLLNSYEFNLVAEKENANQEFLINHFDPYSQYRLYLDYFIRQGSGFDISLVENTNRIEKGEVIPSFHKAIGPDSYWFDKRNFTTEYSPSPAADEARLVLTAEPWNNCESIYKIIGYERCQDPGVRAQYNRRTEVSFRELSLTRQRLSDLILLEKKEVVRPSLPEINFEKIDPTRYEVKVIGAKEPFVLVFSELFNSGWRLSIKNLEGRENKVAEENHFLVNGYANAWRVDQSGDFEAVIEFEPQILLEKTTKVSLISSLSTFFLIGFLWTRSRSQKTS